MNGILKQRLVGALVLIALGVVFWPVIFVEPRQSSLDRSSQVPPMPDHPVTEVAQPRPLEGLQGPQPAQEVQLHEEPPMLVEVPEQVLEEQAEPQPESVKQPERVKQPEPVKKPEPALDDRGIPIAWIVQVATMSRRDSAESLQQQLIELGYKASIKPLVRGEKTLYQVFVGPKFDKGQMEQIKSKVDSRFRVKSVVARYLP